MPKSALARKVSVVVVNWNGRELLGPCLSSLGAQDYPDLEVILVDNGSVDDSLAYLKQEFPWVTIVQSSTNLGYAGGCNLGARDVSGDYVVLLNNDTRLAPDLVSRLVETLNRNPEIGAASAVPVERLETSIPTSPYGVTLNVVGKHVRQPILEITPFYAPGACCMYKRECVDVPYDPEYFAYDEDVYMSWQLRLRGYDIAVNPRARFEHKTSSTSRRIPNYIAFCAERNRWMNLLLFYEVKTLAKLAPLIGANLAIKVLAGVQGLRYKLKAYWWLLRNFSRILEKRNKIQRVRTVPDTAITKHMSSRSTELSGWLTRAANALAVGYLRFLEIPTSETSERSNFGGRNPPTS